MTLGRIGVWLGSIGLLPAAEERDAVSFTVGTADPLLDDTLFMAARWEAAGNEAELRVYADRIHAFNAFPTGIAQAANLAQVEFLQSAFPG